MAHRLNTNKQFMVGNGILAFAVIFVVVIFVYMSMRLQQQKAENRNFIETYTITLTKGFAGDSTSIFINDSLLVNRTMTEEPHPRGETLCRTKRTDDCEQCNREAFPV